MPLDEYLKLLTCRRADGKRGITPQEAPPILDRLGLPADTWCVLVGRNEGLVRRICG